MGAICTRHKKNVDSSRQVHIVSPQSKLERGKQGPTNDVSADSKTYDEDKKLSKSNQHNSNNTKNSNNMSSTKEEVDPALMPVAKKPKVGAETEAKQSDNGVESLKGLEYLADLTVDKKEFETESEVESFEGEFKQMKKDLIGSEQTPIALETKTLEKEVKEAKFICKTNPKPVESTVQNTGRTVQVNWVNGASLEVDGSPYDLLQFHFHWPSEHVVDGKRHLVEMHLVFNNRDESLTRDAKNARLAVVGVFFDLGEASPFIEQFLSAIPGEEGKEGTCEMEPKNLSDIPLNAIWNYSGSLTTPPFSEGVTWIVSSEVHTLSLSQLDRMVKENLRGSNNRALHKRNDRKVSSCGFKCSCL